MVETSTIRYANITMTEDYFAPLFEGGTRIDQGAEDIYGQHTGPYFLPDNADSRCILARLLPEDGLQSNYGAGEPFQYDSSVSTFVNPDAMAWHQIPIGRSLADLSRAEWVKRYWGGIHGYDPRLQDNEATMSLAQLSRDTMNSGFVDVVTAEEYASVNVWTDLIRDLTFWEKTTISDDGEALLAARLQASFECDSVEDGMDHPAEAIITEALSSSKDQKILGWLKGFCLDASRPNFAASVLRCLGRYHHVGTVTWRVGLVREGLAMDNVEIRDAAVQAAESWGDSDLLEVLISHREPEQWLRHYIVDVIGDLGG